MALPGRRQARNTIDFYLSLTRNTAAERFLGKTLSGLKGWEKPTVINADKAQTNAAALGKLKKEGKCPEETGIDRSNIWIMSSRRITAS
jgi:transposase-like protein